MVLVPLGNKGGEGRFLFCSFPLFAGNLHAAPLSEVRIPQVVDDVKLCLEQGAPQPLSRASSIRPSAEQLLSHGEAAPFSAFSLDRKMAFPQQSPWFETSSGLPVFDEELGEVNKIQI